MNFRYLSLLILNFLIGCSSIQAKYFDQKSAIIGEDISNIVACVPAPPERKIKDDFEIAIVRNPAGRVPASDTKGYCEARLKVVNGKITQILLRPEGSTVSGKHPFCLKLFSRCLEDRQTRAVGSGFMKGLVDGLVESSGKLR